MDNKIYGMDIRKNNDFLFTQNLSSGVVCDVAFDDRFIIAGCETGCVAFDFA